MLKHSFIFAKGMTEESERALWGRGITSWELLAKHPEEAAEVLGPARAGKLQEAIGEAQKALAAGDHAWFRLNVPERELWRLWEGYCAPNEVALVDIETTGLTPGYDQVTVIGLADATGAVRTFVQGRPMAGDETLERFRDAIRTYRLIVTFNGASFDLPFIEKHFRETSFRFEQPHLDLLLQARALGLGGGLKDLEKQLGIVRGDDIKEIRGTEAIRLWGAWRGGDQDAYRRLTRYNQADCVNLAAFAAHIFKRRREAGFAQHSRAVDFDRIKGQQLTLF
jgi:uncharacterized protein YprB with RNaseH-like and TPR domain